jgi:hypothetical protein
VSVQEGSDLTDEENDYLLSQIESLEVQLDSIVGEINYVARFCSDTDLSDDIINKVLSSLDDNDNYSNDIVEEG